LGRKSWVLTLIFFGVFGFTLGVACLFLVNVPVEAMLKEQKSSQTLINIAMCAIILVYAVIVISTTVVFRRKAAVIPERSRLAAAILLLLTAISGGIFTLLLTTDSNLVAVFQGTSQQRNSKFMIGPYPEEERLAELKKEGYQGVISLLSPTIPFEKLLLDREMQAGEKIGIRVYSFPMLPWISGNQTSLNGIQELVQKEKGPFYIHCYLGKHRADLVESTLAGTAKSFLYPDYLERGRLNYYQGGKVILGPYPNDEEWFHLVRRGQVKEVISYLDPANADEAPLVEKEKQLCIENGLEFKLLPVRIQGTQVTGLSELLSQAAATNNKMYIHGTKVDARYQIIDASLRSGTANAIVPQLPQELSGGKIYSVHQNLILGPVPNSAETAMLQSQGFNFLNIAKEGNLPPVNAASLINTYIKNTKGACYVFGFSSGKDMELTQQVLLGRFYGIDGIEMKVSGQIVTAMGRFLFIGLKPGPEELNALALRGITTILYPQNKDAKPDEDLRDTQSIAEAQGLNFKVVGYDAGNVNGIIDAVMHDYNPCYVVADSRIRMEIAQDIDAAKLIH